MRYLLGKVTKIDNPTSFIELTVSKKPNMGEDSPVPDRNRVNAIEVLHNLLYLISIRLHQLHSYKYRRV